jgi:hypothetical protein
MRPATTLLACAGLALMGWVGSVLAAGPGPAPPAPPPPSLNPSPFYNGGCGQMAGNPACDPPYLRQWESYREVPFHLEQHVREAKKRDQEYAKKESQKIIDELSVPCELLDADRAGGGKVKLDGRMVDVTVYEASCHSGTGYFLVSQPPQKSLAISCFAAEARHASDVAQGVTPDQFTCTLSGYKDAKEMAASVMKGAGTACDVSGYRWVGVSYKTETEYSEVACGDGKGYVLEVPRTGLATQVSIVNCQDAVKQGVKCDLTAVTMPVTLETLRAAVKEHAPDCAPAQLRYIGRETQGRRYVVELQCPQQPKGVVAFIPLEGNTKPFEIVDCPAAAARAIQCKLTAKQ